MHLASSPKNCSRQAPQQATLVARREITASQRVQQRTPQSRLAQRPPRGLSRRRSLHQAARAARAAEGRVGLGTRRPDGNQRCENTTAPHRSTSCKLGSPQTGQRPRCSGSSIRGNNLGGYGREIRYTRTGADRSRANSPFRRRESRAAAAVAVKASGDKPHGPTVNI